MPFASSPLSAHFLSFVIVTRDRRRCHVLARSVPSAPAALALALPHLAELSSALRAQLTWDNVTLANAQSALLLYLALTRALLKAGHRVAATARTPSKLPFADSEEENLLVLQLDVTDARAVRRALGDAVRRFGRIDVVVNKSGGQLIAELECTPEGEARAMFDAQFWGPARVQELVRKLLLLL